MGWTSEHCGSPRSLSSLPRPERGRAVMSGVPVYQASRIKRRVRSTKAEVESRRAALYDLAAQAAPATVRQIYYLATVAGLVRKPRTDTTRCRPT